MSPSRPHNSTELAAGSREGVQRCWEKHLFPPRNNAPISAPASGYNYKVPPGKCCLEIFYHSHRPCHFQSPTSAATRWRLHYPRSAQPIGYLRTGSNLPHHRSKRDTSNSSSVGRPAHALHCHCYRMCLHSSIHRWLLTLVHHNYYPSHHLWRVCPQPVMLPPSCWLVDRKSTRLNSS